MLKLIRKGLIVLAFLQVAACKQHAWNDPYPEAEDKSNIRYTSFLSSPKTLDPARSYSLDETIFTAQIYEPILQYHFLKRPYTLVPLIAAQMPKVTYFDAKGKRLPSGVPDSQVAVTAYDIAITPGIYYQPHPAFAKNARNDYVYHSLSIGACKLIERLSDFKQVASRELVADDYVYEIKRLALPSVSSPIYGFMSSKIVGLADLANRLRLIKEPKNKWVDLRRYPLAGVRVLDRYHYQILIKGKYPQFLYWLAMPFFAPIPWEADAFYSQQCLVKKNITFDWYPIGTGAYLLKENNPNNAWFSLKTLISMLNFSPLRVSQAIRQPVIFVMQVSGCLS